MRRIVVILSCLLGCLLFTEGSDMLYAPAAGTAVTLSEDRTSSEAWRCEREYNADMNLVRILGEVTPAPAVPAFMRSGHVYPVQTDDRFAASRCGTGVPKATLEFKSSDLSVGPYAVDYYVYRLRRLII